MSSTTKFETLSVATYTDSPAEIWEFEDHGPVNPYHSLAGPLATMRDDDDDLDYAYLFAAAPELLAALQSLVAMNNCNYDRDTDDYRHAMDAARVAITKATGRS